MNKQTTVDRFTIGLDLDRERNQAYMAPHPQGEYVRFEDYAPILAIVPHHDVRAVAEVMCNDAGQVYIEWKGRSMADLVGATLYAEPEYVRGREATLNELAHEADAASAAHHKWCCEQQDLLSTEKLLKARALLAERRQQSADRLAAYGAGP